MALYNLDKTGGGIVQEAGVYVNYNNAELSDVVGDFKIARRVAHRCNCNYPQHNCGTG